MDSTRPREGAGTADPPASRRRQHLSALDSAVAERPDLACGIVVRHGIPTLHVVRYGCAGRPLKIGCDFDAGTWWFVCAHDGRKIAPVDDVPGAVRLIDGALPSRARRSR
ncbi:UNVERIFIED_ORG: hypothetical protein CLV66_103481 [Actinomadura viridilutea]|nr:hypothetical protein [Actinomadura rubrobrunea]